MTDIYIINKSTQLTQSLQDIVAAMQEQVSRDFAPLWGITANVYGADVAPAGAWTINLVDYVDGNNLGYHVDSTGIPNAIVGIGTCLSYGVEPSTAISHELLEMLADPTAARLVGPYLMEVCDPVTQSFYEIGNNVLVTNFVTPRYFGLTNMGHFDQLNLLSAGVPQCTQGGMIMWWDGTNWNQTFARTAEGNLSWRANLKGRSYHRASQPQL